MFRGISAVNLDAKGRIAVPVRYRDSLKEMVVMTIDTELPCLLLYPQNQWAVIEEKLQTLPSLNKATRRIKHLLMGHATELELDENGRLLLPKILRDYAKLEKQTVLVGQGAKLEIWDELTWQSYREQWLSEAGENLDNLPEELQDMVF